MKFHPLASKIAHSSRTTLAMAGVALMACWLVLNTGDRSAHAQDQTLSQVSVLRATLANGLEATVIRNPIAPVVTTVVNYHVGSNEAPAGFPGMAHAQEHMMFRGSPGLTAGQLADINAAMGGSFDADTQQTVTQYFFTVPAEYLDVALHIEAIRMRGVLDSEKLWQAGARRHRTGGGQGSVESGICLLHAAVGGHVQGNTLCP